MGLTVDGKFFAISAYALSLDATLELEWTRWKLIWKLRVRQRVKVFLWLLSHDKMLINYALLRRSIAESSTCSTCDSLKEDSLQAILLVHMHCRTVLRLGKFGYHWSLNSSNGPSSHSLSRNGLS